MIQAVILARVSTSRQEKEGLSLREIQIPLLQEYAQNKGFSVIREFTFSESADRKIRNKFHEMVEFVKQNPKVKTIIAYRVDRITRNYRDAVLIDELIKDHDKEIHFVDDRLMINRDSKGRDIQDWDLKVFLAKQYLNRLKDDAKNSAALKLSRGEWPGQAPFGYINIQNGTRNKWIEADPIESEVVRFIYTEYATGSVSMDILVRRVENYFQVKLVKAAIDRILKNKFYIGIMQYDGHEYPHSYEQIIDKQLYLRVQNVKASFNKKTGHKYAGLPFAYRGLISCSECGLALSPEMKKKKYVYYKCTEYQGKHGAKYIKEENITEQLAIAFRNIKVPADVIESIVKTLKNSHKDKKDFYEQQKRAYQNEFNKYKNRQDKMYTDRLDGLISTEDYLARNSEYQDKLDFYQAQLLSLEGADNEYYSTANAILSIAHEAEDLFKSSEVEEKRKLINLVLQNLKIDGLNLVYEYARPFNILAQSVNCNEWQGMRDSNSRRLGS